MKTWIKKHKKTTALVAISLTVSVLLVAILTPLGTATRSLTINSIETASEPFDGLNFENVGQFNNTSIKHHRLSGSVENNIVFRGASYNRTLTIYATAGTGKDSTYNLQWWNYKVRSSSIEDISIGNSYLSFFTITNNSATKYYIVSLNRSGNPLSAILENNELATNQWLQIKVTFHKYF